MSSFDSSERSKSKRVIEIASLDNSRLKKLQIVGQLYDFAMATKSQFFRNQFPDATNSEIRILALESIERGTR